MDSANSAPAKEAAAKQQAASPATVYINRAVGTVTLVNAPITTNNTQNNTQEKLLNCCEDIESIKGKFSWQLISGFQVPYIIRIINGELLKFVSVRMAETHLLSNYLPYLHADIHKCTSVRSHYVTDSEAKLLNKINKNHTDCVYGKEMFFAGKDYIVSLEDVHELYMFMEVCYKKLMCNFTSGSIERCGFIRINSESVVPYCIKDNQKFVPLFFFKGNTLNLEHQAIKFDNWNLAYLKFCCTVQGIKNEFFASNSYAVVKIDDIKNYFPPETNFEEYWPAKVVEKLLTNNKSTHLNSPGTWIRTSPEIAPAKNTIPHTSTAPTPVLTQFMPVMMNTFQNRWPRNLLAQPPLTTRVYSIAGKNKIIAAQCYNTRSKMSQASSLINNEGHVVPPLVHAGNTAPMIGNTISYSNDVSINHCRTTTNNTMTNSNVILHSSQMRQVYTQCSINSQAQQQQLEQKQTITTPKTRKSCSGQSVGGRYTNTQQNYTLRNIGPIVTDPPSEIIDLSSPPSSPVSPTMLENSLIYNIGWTLKRIPERMIVQDPLNIVAYKIQQTSLQGKMISCINAKPYIYSNLMVTLDDLVQKVLPSCTVTTCAYVLNKYLKTELFRGNSEQLALLRENKLLKSMHPDDTPLAMLQDVMHVLQQFKILVFKLNEQQQQIKQQQSSEGQSKRKRTI
ncbi:hypothetical protein QTP88_023969 [Uroleucon formosanum]